MLHLRLAERGLVAGCERARIVARCVEVADRVPARDGHDGRDERDLQPCARAASQRESSLEVGVLLLERARLLVDAPPLLSNVLRVGSEGAGHLPILARRALRTHPRVRSCGPHLSRGAPTHHKLVKALLGRG